MATEITTSRNALPSTSEDYGGQVLRMIAEAAANPSVDVAKMAALLDMQERVMRNQQEAAFNTAFAAMQAGLPSIGKRGEIKNKAGQVQSRYAKWEDMHRVLKPILQAHGFALSFEIGSNANMTTVEAILCHSAGHVRRSGAMLLPRDDSGSKNAVQGMGAAVSYGKRYTTTAILNIVTEGEDTDGNTKSASLDAMDELRSDAAAAASAGLANYERWYKHDITTEDRRRLHESGEHERLKAVARAADQTNVFPGDR